MDHTGAFTSIAQRAAYTYLRALTACEPAQPEQRALYLFFQNLYSALYQQPERFGLPLTPDGFYTSGQASETGLKSDLRKRMKRPKEIIAAGLAFLRAVGRTGELQDQALIVPLEILTGYLKQTRPAKAFLQGLADCGLLVAGDGTSAKVQCPGAPEMLPALQTLAQACDAFADPLLGAFHFARCDFRALDRNFTPDVMDLYQVFTPEQCARLVEMHHFFTSMGYKPSISIHDVSMWVVQYQGRREVKSTPLYQVDFDERHETPLVVQIKPVASNRLLPVLADGPKFLRDDFIKRAYRCNGSKCDWCRNRTNLGPTTVEHDGQTDVLCWYSNGTIDGWNDASMELIRQYAWAHEKLAPQR